MASAVSGANILVHTVTGTPSAIPGLPRHQPRPRPRRPRNFEPGHVAWSLSLFSLSLSLSLSLSPPPPPLLPSLSVPIYLLIKSEQLWDDSAQCLAVARVSVHVCAREPRQAASLHALAPPSHLTLSVICFPAMAQAAPCSDCSGIALSSVPVAMATMSHT